MRVPVCRHHVLGDVLWLSQVLRDIDSKFSCYFVALCIYLGGFVAPFLWPN